MGLKMWGSWSEVWFMTTPVFPQPLGLTHVTLSHIKLVNKLSFSINMLFNLMISNTINIIKTIIRMSKGYIVYKMLSRLNSISPRAVPGGVMPGVFSPVSLQSCVTSNWAGIKLSGSHVTCVLCSLHETLSRGALQPECRREYSGSLPLLCCISPPMFTMRSQWRWQWWRWWLVIMS